MTYTAFQLDNSFERAICDEKLDGRHSLMHDMRRGFHAKAVVSELEHAKRVNREARVIPGDLEMRLECTMPSSSFHILGQKYGYEAFNDDEFMAWRMNRFPEMRVNATTGRTMIVVGNKYGPPNV
jgi:hypothetical protein